jgi:hypothetical protein
MYPWKFTETCSPAKVQAAVAPALDPVEAGVLADLEIGVRAAGVRVPG